LRARGRRRLRRLRHRLRHPTSEDRFADLTYYVDGLVRRSVRMVSTITGNRRSTSSATASAARSRSSTARSTRRPCRGSSCSPR
jgi:hypothetical protein